MKKIITLTFVALMSFTLTAKGQSEVIDLTVYQLIVNGKAFHGSTVQLAGKLDLSHKEDFALYPDESSYSYQILRNSVRLSLSKEDYNKYKSFHGAFVQISGFYSNEKESLYGEITKINSVILLDKRSD